MKLYPRLAIAAVILALASCRPGVAEYSEVEAPKQLTLDNASIRTDVRFAPGSSHLLAGDAARLHALAASGKIAPSDRVTVSVAGDPLSPRRGSAQSRPNCCATASSRPRGRLPRWRPTGRSSRPSDTSLRRRLVPIEQEPAARFHQHPVEQLGCATATNFGRMVASPADLAEGVLSGSPTPSPPPPPYSAISRTRLYCRPGPVSGRSARHLRHQPAAVPPERVPPGVRHESSSQRRQQYPAAAKKPDREGIIAVLQDQPTLDRVQRSSASFSSMTS